MQGLEFYVVCTAISEKTKVVTLKIPTEIPQRELSDDPKALLSD